MPVPRRIPIYRLMHVDNLPLCLERGGMHAPRHSPHDGRVYRTIHNIDIQESRRERLIHCGLGGTVHDYVAFYFGPRSPMLLQLNTGRVEGYSEGQAPLIYIVSMVETIVNAGLGFVFSDGHGIAIYTKWFDNISDMDKVDWSMVYENYWADSLEDSDRQRRKQAEFLVHRFCPWDVVSRIGVLNDSIRRQVMKILADHDESTPVKVCNDWYY